MKSHDHPPTVEGAIKFLLSDPDAAEQIALLKEQPQELADLLAAKGYVFSPEQWKAGLETFAGELSEQELKGVAGGSVQLIRSGLGDDFLAYLNSFGTRMRT